MKKKSILSNRVAPNLKKLPLTEYYSSIPDIRHVPEGTLTPKLVLLYAIADVTGKSHETIRRWVSGKAAPTPLEKDAVAHLLQSDVEILFPEPTIDTVL
jgi:hypothetical protein